MSDTLAENMCYRVAPAVAGAMLNPFVAVEERLCFRHNDIKARPRFRAQTRPREAPASPFSSASIKSQTHVAILFSARLRPEAV